MPPFSESFWNFWLLLSRVPGRLRDASTSLGWSVVDARSAGDRYECWWCTMVYDGPGGTPSRTDGRRRRALELPGQSRSCAGHPWDAPPGSVYADAQGDNPKDGVPGRYPDVSSSSGDGSLSLRDGSDDCEQARAPDLNPAYTFENFVVGPCNRIAHAAAVSICDPGDGGASADVYNPLLLYGDPGTGKTHLLHSVCERMRQIAERHAIFYQSCEEFTNRYIASVKSNSLTSFRRHYRHAEVLALDDLDFLSGRKRTQEEFFHTLSDLVEKGTHVLLSCSRSPREWSGLQSRLASRLQSGLVARLGPPDVETRTRILLGKARYRGCELPAEVAAFIVSRVRGDLREVEGALSKVLIASSSNNTPVSLELTRSVLEDPVPMSALTVSHILQAVEEHFHLPRKELLSPSKVRSLVYARQTGMYLTRELTPLSLEEIGRQFGGRDHTTVIYALHRIEELETERPEVKATLRTLRDAIASQQLLTQ